MSHPPKTRPQVPGGQPGADHSASPTVDQHPPDRVLSLSSIDRTDYADLFVLTGELPLTSPRQWAVAVLEDEAGLGGQIIWRLLLSLRLAWRSTPDHIAGWKVGGGDQTWIRLEARGPLMSGNLILRIEDDEVCLATFIHYNHRVGAWLWPKLSDYHRRSAPALLRNALARLGDSS